MERSQVGLVIPAFNEAETILSVVKAASEYGHPIVVNDGSSDATARQAEIGGATVVNHPINQGYDSAISSGFKEAARLGCELIITLDADGQHDPDLISKFIEQLTNGADVALGVRNQRPRFAEFVFSIYSKKRYGILDPLCGMKGYKRSVYESLGHFDSYKSIGTELTLHAARNNFQIKQIYFIVRPRSDKPRFGKLINANLKIFRAMWIDIFKF